MSGVANFIAGAIATALAHNVTRRLAEWAAVRNLRQPSIQPGPWYAYYVGDWMVAHDVVDTNAVTSAVWPTPTGYLWATDTPEWDRGWFEARGYEFPNEWTTFESASYFAKEK